MAGVPGLGRTITINGLWDLFAKYGYEVRYKKKKGNDAWSAVKPLLSSIDNNCKFAAWEEKSLTYYDILKGKFGLFGDTRIDANGIETNDSVDPLLWEPQHFMLQHGRICKNNSPSLMRLLQIAYNSGQLRAERQLKGNKAFTDEQILFYDNPDNGMTDIKSYISGPDLETLEAVINNEPILGILVKIISIVSNTDNLPSMAGGRYKSIMTTLYGQNKIYYVNLNM
jgi:hypothetical protein